MTETRGQKDQMHIFLGELVTEILGWHSDVTGVAVYLDLSNRFEENGWDGTVRVYLLGNRQLGLIVPSYELAYARSRVYLMEALHYKFNSLMSKEFIK